MWRLSMLIVLWGFFLAGTILKVAAQPMKSVELHHGGRPLQNVYATNGRVHALYGREDHGREWIQLSSDTVRRINLSPGQLLSPSRDRYFYVEKLPAFPGYAFGPNVDDGVRPRSRLRDSFSDWDDNPPALRVHVYRLSGEKARTIDLPLSYCGNYAQGQWLGDRWIWLRHRYGHRSGNFYSLFADVETGKKRLLGWTIRKALATPDGRFVTFRRYGVLYVDFRPVYPIHGEKVADFGEEKGWESHKQKYLVRREKRPHQRLANDDLRVLSYDFTPDGKQAVLFTATPDAGIEHVDSSGSRYTIVTGTDVVLIDLEMVQTSSNPAEYSRRIPLPENAVRLERDDKNAEFHAKDTAGKILWRRTFVDLARP